MNEIHQLDDRTVDRIAAGEVVERPASVVKELVENALDADADRIDVSVADGGRERVAVADDGIGMSREAARTAVRQHTTSKIEDVADLEAGVATLGFRGEALHAVGSVARLTITTRPRGGEVGTELVVEGGDVVDVGPAGCPEGTTVTVEDLFFNVPARRKYLERASTEFAHVNRVVTSYALANPDVAVSLTHDGRETFATTGQGDLRETVLSVYGSEVARAMLPVDARDAGADGDRDDADADSAERVGGDGDDDGESDGDGGDDARATLPPGVSLPSVDADGAGAGDSGNDARVDLADGPLAAVTGLVSHPETNRAGREYLSTYVNGRYVRSSTVRDAVVDAYGDQLAGDRYPFAVLFLAVDPSTVDVNVHPRKMEVRFAEEAGVREQVRSAVRDALLREGLLRSRAPRGRSAAEQTTIEPGGAGETGDGRAGDATDERPGETDDGRAADGTRAAPDDEPASTASPGDGGPAGSDGGLPGSDGEATATDDGVASADAASTDADATDATSAGAARSGSHGAGSGGGAGVESAGADVGPDRPAAGGPDDEASRSDGAGATERPDAGEDPNASGDADDAATASSARATGGFEQARLGGDADATVEFDALPSMRIMGQLAETYVVAETDDGLVLIDQHAADERINYERLKRAFESETTTQALAEPVEVELTAREAALFEEWSDALASLGFHADRTGERTVAVRTVPGVVAEAAGPELVRDVLSAFVEGDASAAETVEAAADELLADLACHPSVTGNTSLTEGSIRTLLSELDDCENPYACPHGRPVVVAVDADEIAARFERDYPGHGGRRQ